MKRKPKQQPPPRTPAQAALQPDARADAPLARRDPKLPPHPGLAYLSTVGGDLLRLMPASSAVEPTRREINSALESVQARIDWLTNTLLDERAARAKNAPAEPEAPIESAEADFAAAFGPRPLPDSEPEASP